MRRITLSVLVAAILFVMLIPVSSDKGEASTAEIRKIEEQLKALEEQKKQAERNAARAAERIQEIGSERQTVSEEINVLLGQIDESELQLLELETSIAEQEEELEIAQTDLENTIVRIEERDNLLRSRLHLMYTNGAVSYLEVLLESTSFSDFLGRFDALKSLVNQDQEILKSNRRDKELLEQQTSQVESMLIQLAADYEEIEILRRDLMNQQYQKEVMIASLNQEEEDLVHVTEEQEQILIEAAKKEAELQQRKNRIEEEEARRKREEERLRQLQRQNQLTGLPEGGKFSYPLPRSYRLSSDFGNRVDPITGRKGAFHQGIDFAAPSGTNVLAAGSGRVLVAEWYGGYGNTVIIDHGDGYWTLYAHMRNNSISVKVGDSVTTGDKLGEVGTTGRSTGNHLHFEVRKNYEYVDPKPYLNM